MTDRLAVLCPDCDHRAHVGMCTDDVIDPDGVQYPCICGVEFPDEEAETF